MKVGDLIIAKAREVTTFIDSLGHVASENVKNTTVVVLKVHPLVVGIQGLSVFLKSCNFGFTVGTWRIFEIINFDLALGEPY